jgi:sterol desaturase/sphingolipid hydroxylase (fatty acid hydroxylase superfamily)
MTETIRQFQAYVLGGAFLLLWLMEGWAPNHARAEQRWRHAGVNLLLTALYVAAGVGFGAANAWLAEVVMTKKAGLLHWVQAPFAVALIGGVLALDLAAYAGHIVKHKLPIFWRFHQVHHSDKHLDVTTGFRFHPVEALISWVFLAPTIVAFGIRLPAIVTFAGLYAIAALVQHANVRLPLWLDRALRVLWVSPAFHRVHHSPHREETDSNYAAIFSFWDRIFRTYRTCEPQGAEFGLEAEDCDSVRATLIEPFLRKEKVASEARTRKELF